jgi:hypothetical protein
MTCEPGFFTRVAHESREVNPRETNHCLFYAASSLYGFPEGAI